MDISDELRLSHKRTFLKFFDHDERKNIFADEIRNMIHHKRRRLIINLANLFNHEEGNDLARRLLRTPSEYMQSLSDAVTEVARSLDPKYLKEGEKVLVGFEGPFVSRRVTPRDLLSNFIGSLICVEGIVQ